MHVKRPEVWEKVHELKKSRIWYLSTIKLFGGFIYETHKRSLFLNDIDGKVVSYQIHEIKPNSKIYLYLLDKYNLKADQCLFLMIANKM